MIDEKLQIDRYKNQIVELFKYLANKTGLIYLKETRATYPAVKYKYYNVDGCYEFGLYYDEQYFEIYDNGYTAIEHRYCVNNRSVEEIIGILLECIKKIKLESIKIRKNNINDDF